MNNFIRRINDNFDNTHYRQSKLKKMKYLDSKKLLEWFKKLNFISFIFNETTHNELIRSSKMVFSFLAFVGQINKKEIDIIWKFHKNKHESVVEAVYDVIQDLSRNLNKKTMNYLYKKF